MCMVLTLMSAFLLPVAAAGSVAPVTGNTWDFIGVDADGIGAGWTRCKAVKPDTHRLQLQHEHDGRAVDSQVRHKR